MEDLRMIIAKTLIDSLPKDITISSQEIYSLVEQPRSLENGDFAFPCFVLSKQMKRPPVQIAQSIETALGVNKIPGIMRIEANGPYVNFFLDKGQQAETLVKQVFVAGDSFGKPIENNKQTIAIEYPGPNTNKPLHLGHARLMILGRALRTLLEHRGHRVITVNINNDRGVHICKSMLAYKLFGEGAEPDKKSDHYVGDWYVRYAREAAKNPELEEQIHDMLRKWEQGDEETRALWKKMRIWCLDGFAQTYKTFGVKIDKEYYESDFYNKARSVVEDGLARGVFEKRDDGAIIAKFSDEGLPEKVVLRADGTTIYITQDIYLAQLRYEDFHMDAMIYMVGNEQNLHFKQLFAILKKLNAPFANRLEHLATGMIYLPSGKMKSREGNVVDSDELLQQLIDMATEETRKRDQSLGDEEIARRGRIIGEGALRFFILKYNPKNDFVFDVQASISFEGETGPYLQYTYARIRSILRKDDAVGDANFSLLSHEHEIGLITTLSQFSFVVDEAGRKHAPYLIAHYLIGLAKEFNSFYHACPILQSKEALRATRLALCKATAQVLKNGLSLLNIGVLEEM